MSGDVICEPCTRNEAEEHVRRWRRKGLIPVDVERLLPTVELRVTDPFGIDASAEGEVAGKPWKISAYQEGFWSEGWRVAVEVTFAGAAVATVSIRVPYRGGRVSLEESQDIGAALLWSHIRALHLRGEL